MTEQPPARSTAAPRHPARDRLIAAAIAVVVLAAGVILYQRSDIRAATSAVGTSSAYPTEPSSAPTALTQRWTATTDPRLGAAVTGAGVVAVADEHGITGLDATTGRSRWSYSRANRQLCAIGSGDALQANGVQGVVTVYRDGDFCSQIESFDAATGARSKVRTSPLPADGQLVFGAGYAGWLSPGLVEIWRNDLYRTAQYGDQPNPPQSGTAHLGCTLEDLAIANTQYATIEHCQNQGPNARIVLNFDDPGDHGQNLPKDWDSFKFHYRIDQDTGSKDAMIVGITADRVAVLVSSPQPAVVVYDAAGDAVSRTPVDIPADAITAAAQSPGPTPAVMAGDTRISLIGSSLIAVASSQADVPAPQTTLVTSSSETTTSASGPGLGNLLSGQPATTPSTPPAPTTSVSTLQLSWVGSGARGLPAVLGTNLLVPVDAGLAVYAVRTGPGAGVLTPIPVDRAGYQGRVEVAAVGDMVVEIRGGTVVGLAR